MDNRLLNKMIEYFNADPKRIQHFIKVYAFAKMIGEEEGLDEKTRYILETAAIVHDIGIKPAEEKYGDCNGKLQEKEGPAVVRKLLNDLGYEPEVIERVSYLVGHHHTYTNVEGMDYQILLEADYLVNADESQYSHEAICKFRERVFKSESGTHMLESIYSL